MSSYVLVKNERGNHHIGNRLYETKELAEERQSELLKFGIEMEVMSFKKAVGDN